MFVNVRNLASQACFDRGAQGRSQIECSRNLSTATQKVKPFSAYSSHRVGLLLVLQAFGYFSAINSSAVQSKKLQSTIFFARIVMCFPQELFLLPCSPMQRFHRNLILIALLINGLSLHAIAQSEKADLEAAQLLKRHCVECHGEAKQEGSLRLDRQLSDGAAHLANSQQPETSELIIRVTYPAGHAERMPPTGPGLTLAEVSILKQWIEHGARWPTEMETLEHWAYKQPQQLTVPSNNSGKDNTGPNTWSSSPLDAFVLEKLNAQGMQPAPREKPEKLLRRLYLDLIGLPPPPQVSIDFAANPTEEKYHNIVESLLAHPGFGERWGRVWLDAAHYADSHGFQRDDLRDLWPYRDWVIQALNNDMPFDQFTMEQLAGDLIPNASEQQKIATGFLRCTPTNVEAGSLPEETRIEQIFDRVNTIGTIWLGSTFECAQCHDHKYDPFTMKDYYQVFACFNNTEAEANLADPKVPSSIKFQGPYLELHDEAVEKQRADLKLTLNDVRDKLQARSLQIEKEMSTWYANLQTQALAASESHILQIRRFESQGTTDGHQVLDDGSVLLTGGDPPDTDTYDIIATRPLKNIRAIRLDALKHPTLPGQGPGRGDPVKSNFVLNEFSAELVNVDDAESAEPNAKEVLASLKFNTATANYSQPNYSVTNAIDEKPQTGWAIGPQFDRDHHAVFTLMEPLDLNENQALRIRMLQQFGNGRTLGRFKLTAITGDPEQHQLPSNIRSLLAKPITQLAHEERQHVKEFYKQTDQQSLELKKRISKLETKISDLSPTRTLVAKELASPRQSFQFIRGDYRQLGEEVSPGIPSMFRADSTTNSISEPINRLRFAQWLVSTENPLASRATVNRWWQEIFGNGIVTTPEDFGLKGALPSHPELLDWLTLYYQEHNNSLKQLLKVVVLSETYRQSSATTKTQWELDPENRWLARGPRFRLDAETIRDNILSIAGLLNMKQSGPPIYPQQPDGLWTKIGGQVYNYETSSAAESNRRSIYVVWKRASPYPSMMNFDASSRLVCTVQRSRTNTPLQALTLLNDPVYVNAAKQFAKRIERETAGKPWNDQLDDAFRMALGRVPSATEHVRLKKLFDEAVADSTRRSDAISANHIGWFEVATVLLNLHETITKE